MSQNFMTRARGLYTLQNALSEIPEGSLTTADNVVIDRDGVINPRRGFALYGSAAGNISSTVIKQLLSYKGRLFRHYASTLDYDSDGNGAFSSLSTSIVEQATGSRIKYSESNGNFYFTTASGIKKISATDATGIASAAITNAGGVEALGGQAVVNSTPGFLPQESTVAYRVVWGIKDANTNVILGVPSSRIIVTNPLLNLLISNINTLLADLTIVGNNNTGGSFSDVTLNQRELSEGASADQVYNLLVALSGGTSGALDTDLSFNANVTTVAGSAVASMGSTANIVAGMKLTSNSNIPTPTVYGDITIGSNVIQNTGLTLTGTLNGTTTVTGIVDTSRINVGASVIGTGIPFGATVASIASSTSITLSTAATATASGVSLQFVAGVPGMWITGTGIPADSVVVSVTNNSITISNNATASGSGQQFSLGCSVLSVASNGTQFTLSVPALSSATLVSTHFGNVSFGQIAAPTAPTEAPSTVELLAIQAYYDAIVNELNSHPGFTTSGKSFIGGAFSNSTQSSGVNITFYVPSPITTTHFYQIYRSAVFSSTGNLTLSDISPDDELFLVEEDNPTSAQISAHQVTFTDTVADIFRANGTPLYTNSNSGEGISQSNFPPPLAQDMTLFNNVMFYANTQTAQRLNLDLLTTTNLSGGTVTFTENAVNYTLTFAPEVEQAVRATVIAKASFTNSGTADYIDVTAANNTTTYRIYFQPGGATAPSGSGVTLVPVDISAATTAHDVAVDLRTAVLPLTDFTPITSFVGDILVGYNLIDNVVDTSFLYVGMVINNANFPGGTTITGIGTNNTVTVSNVAAADSPNATINFDKDVYLVNNAFGQAAAPVKSVANAGFLLTTFATGSGENASTGTVGVSSAPTPGQAVDETARSVERVVNSQTSWPFSAYYMSGPNDIPGILRFENKNLGDPAFSVIASTTAVGGDFNPTIPISGTTVISTNEIAPNRVMWSKVQQPEAVPLVNYTDVGPRDKAIKRIVALRDSLFILSEAGIYQLTGTDPSNFSVSLFDNTTKITAADSATTMNNQVFMMSDQGVVTISNTGVQVISRPIENQLIGVSAFTTFPTATFASSYNSDRAYMLWTVQSSSDTFSQQCFRYNTFTQTWTRWPISKNAAIVIPESEILYAAPTDVNFVEKERKSFSRLDYADRQFDLTILPQGFLNNKITLLSVGKAAIGDVLVQTQYLTIAQFNRVLRALDSDRNLTFKHYFSTLGASSGVNLRISLTNLAMQLDLDHTSGGYATAISSFGDTFLDQQNAFNTIVSRLNLDNQVSFHTYPASTGTTEWEISIQSVSSNNNTVVAGISTIPFISGDVVLYKSISTDVMWAPQYFSDPSVTKHVREATFLFQTMEFTTAMGSFGSDLRPGQVYVPIIGEGTGIWGEFNWGMINFGGEGSSRPFRTLIPMDKQRCRYLLPQFKHACAFEKYSIYGISFTFEIVSSRGYR